MVTWTEASPEDILRAEEELAEHEDIDINSYLSEGQLKYLKQLGGLFDAITGRKQENTE